MGLRGYPFNRPIKAKNMWMQCTEFAKRVRGRKVLVFKDLGRPSCVNTGSNPLDISTSDLAKMPHVREETLPTYERVAANVRKKMARVTAAWGADEPTIPKMTTISTMNPPNPTCCLRRIRSQNRGPVCRRNPICRICSRIRSVGVLRRPNQVVVLLTPYPTCGLLLMPAPSSNMEANPNSAPLLPLRAPTRPRSAVQRPPFSHNCNPLNRRLCCLLYLRRLVCRFPLCPSQFGQFWPSPCPYTCRWGANEAESSCTDAGAKSYFRPAGKAESDLWSAIDAGTEL